MLKLLKKYGYDLPVAKSKLYQEILAHNDLFKAEGFDFHVKSISDLIKYEIILHGIENKNRIDNLYYAFYHETQDVLKYLNYEEGIIRIYYDIVRRSGRQGSGNRILKGSGRQSPRQRRSHLRSPFGRRGEAAGHGRGPCRGVQAEGLDQSLFEIHRAGAREGGASQKHALCQRSPSGGDIPRQEGQSRALSHISGEQTGGLRRGLPSRIR